ncbi:MAG: NAD(P)/FAD-dependent oxidoreductase [Bacteroidia bacterium]
MKKIKVAVIGGGAAGFFAAISCKQHHPEAEVHLLEKSDKLLAKVKVSGGGRCNVTNATFTVSELIKNYPRGGNKLKKIFSQFNTQDTFDWFFNRGIKLKTEPDNRVFPVTDNSQTIINCLMEEAAHLGIIIKKQFPVNSIIKEDDYFLINSELKYNKVIIATGGNPKIENYNWLKELGHNIIPPVPSLFTFNLPGEKIRELMGVVAEPAKVSIAGTGLNYTGPLLITHWGMSGPAVLKLSAFGARILNEMNYNFTIRVSWAGDINEDTLRELISEKTEEGGKKKIINFNPVNLPARLWLFLLAKININENIPWNELNKKDKNRLVNLLLNDEYYAKGKTTFKEEFVTAGGVDLADMDMETMQSRKCEGLYFAGEVLDIDGITGGFNFQAAWSTGYIAGKLL